MTTNYAWATDIHLNFLETQAVIDFATALGQTGCTGVFLTGDISHAPQLIYHLSIIDKILQRPVYFVLGNHDFYNGNIEQVRKTAREISNLSPFLKYLGDVNYAPITTATALVGHDGWYDAQYGDWKRSTMALNDWHLIHEFVNEGGSISNLGPVVSLSRKLAHEAVTHIRDGIKAAVRYHKNIVILTHVPPFRETCMHEGKPGEVGSIPWFSCKMLGDMLMDAAEAFKAVNFTVLCGHTHSRAQVKVTDNLSVYVGEAEYHRPRMEQLIALP